VLAYTRFHGLPGTDHAANLENKERLPERKRPSEEAGYRASSILALLISNPSVKGLARYTALGPPNLD
jgi:hypothetical protein